MLRRIAASLTALTAALLASSLAPGAAHAADNCAPSRVMLVLDRSSSMQTGTIGGVSKWSIAVDAIDTVVTEFDSKLELGLNVFPEPDQCSPGVVKAQPALGNAAAIMSELGTPPPNAGNWTPMAQTLSAVAQETSLTSPGAPAYAVLITDGWQWCDPYDANTRFDPVDSVSQLSAAGITTYVVGFGGAVDALALNQMAVEAGTARPGCDPSGATPGLSTACYFSAQTPAELVQALQDIAVTTSTEICDGEDNDCDGEVDEDITRACGSNCGVGTETCDNGTWTDCTAPMPEVEICDGADNDCDGSTDDGCDCVTGDSRSCGGADACTPGTQTCAADGTWGACEGAVYPESETCDGADNDCDGDVDEMDDDVGNLCGPGFMCTPDGNCEPLPPQDPPGDDEPDDDGFGADGDGAPAGGCGCDTGDRIGDSAGSGILLMLAGLFVFARRRRRM